MKYIVGI